MSDGDRRLRLDHEGYIRQAKRGNDLVAELPELDAKLRATLAANGYNHCPRSAMRYYTPGRISGGRTFCTRWQCPDHGPTRRRVLLVGMNDAVNWAGDDLALVILPPEANWSSFTQQVRRTAKQAGNDAQVVCSVQFDDGHRDVLVRLDCLESFGGSWPPPIRAAPSLLLRILARRIWGSAVAEANPGFVPHVYRPARGGKPLPRAEDHEHTDVMAAVRERLDDSYFPDGTDVPVMMDEARFVGLYAEELEATRYTDGLHRAMRTCRES